MLWVALSVSLLVMILLLFAEHETEYRSWHSTYGEDLEHALVVWVVGGLVCGMLVLALRFGFAMGILAGVAAALGGFVMLVAAAVVHVLSDVRHDTAGRFVLMGCIGLCVLGFVIVIVELVMRVNQRAENRRNAFPRAVVVTK